MDEDEVHGDPDGYNFMGTIDPSKTTLEDLDRLANQFSDIKGKIRNLENEIESLKQELRPIEGGLVQYLNHSDKQRYHCGVGTLYIQRQEYYAVPKEERLDKFLEWLPTVGIEPKEILSIHSQTLNALVKEQIKLAAEKGDVAFLPPGLSEPSLRESIRIKK